MLNHVKKTTVIIFSVLVLNGCHLTEQNTTDETKKMLRMDFFSINQAGELERPKEYRNWVYVGTPLTPNDMNNGKAAFQEFHNVYIDPVSYEYYKTHGTWREDTILVKELVSVGSKAAVSGSGYFMGDFIGLEATIKSKKHFPNEPGNWAYFSFTNHETGILADTNKPFASESCNSCHAGAAKDDFVFTQYYPVLAAAKNHGSGPVEKSSVRHALPNR